MIDLPNGVDLKDLLLFLRNIGLKSSSILKDFENGLISLYDLPENLSIDFTAHAASMGATAKKVASIKELEEALSNRHSILGPYVIVIDTDPYPSTSFGGTWWSHWYFRGSAVSRRYSY